MRKLFYLVVFLLLFTATSFAAEEKLIILDSSLSMGQPVNGVPKYTIAIQAAKKQLQKMNPSERIGLRTIGLPLDSSVLSFLMNPDELCKATQLTAPIMSYNFQNIESALDSIVPLGTTPLTYALDTAIKYDFSSGYHTKHIILITDGAESCNNNPCLYIRKLMETRKDIVIDIIAIGVTNDELNQLKCLTDATTGTIIAANTTKQIEDAFGNLFNSPQQSQTLPKQNTVSTPSMPQNLMKNNNGVTYKTFLYETYE